jgi:hypothetical protein
MGLVRGGCLVLTITFGLASAAAAQPAPKTGSFLSLKMLGIEGGLTAAALQTAEGAGSSWTQGFQIGLFVTGGPHAVTWQVGGQFQRKGGEIGHARIRSTYIEVPVFLRINLRPDRKTRFHLLAGPTAGYRMSAALESGGEVTDLGGFGKSYDVSAVVGGGLSVGLLDVGVRFSQGLIATGIVVDGPMTRNRVWALVLGLKSR